MNRSDEVSPAFTKSEFATLARFRHTLRQFLRFSEIAARQEHLTPQQHQLLLAIAGHPDRDWMTVGEVAEALQLNHNAVVQLVDRVQALGLVRRSDDPDDRRVVRVELAELGKAKLARLTAMHRDELRRLHDDLAPLFAEMK